MTREGARREGQRGRVDRGGFVARVRDLRPGARWTAREQQYRDALMAALIPAPGGALPALEHVDLRAFWPELDAVAPVHLRVGLRVACVTLGLLPRVWGYGRALPELSADERETFMVRAASTPHVGELVEVAKVVAGLAYFSDPAVQAAARAPKGDQP